MLPVKGLLRGGEGTLYFLYSQLFGICFFALLYWMLAARVPGKHFKGLGMFPRFFDFLYFSMVTQTTVGYGDIAPASRLARRRRQLLGWAREGCAVSGGPSRPARMRALLNGVRPSSASCDDR